MKRFPEAKWDFGKLSSNYNITLEWLKRFPEKKWNFRKMCKRYNLIELQLSLKNIPIFKIHLKLKQKKVICILLNKENFNYLSEHKKMILHF